MSELHQCKVRCNELAAELRYVRGRRQLERDWFIDFLKAYLGEKDATEEAGEALKLLLRPDRSSVDPLEGLEIYQPQA